MKNRKWRIILSVADTLLSLGLSPQFYHGLLAGSVTVLYLVRCLNLVPAAFVEVTGIWRTYHVVLGGRSSGLLFYFFWNSQFLNFLFWWWVGWKIDLRVASRDCGRVWTLAEAIAGFTLSLIVFLEFRTVRHFAVARGSTMMTAGYAVQAARIGWALALFCYFAFRLRQLWATDIGHGAGLQGNLRGVSGRVSR